MMKQRTFTPLIPFAILFILPGCGQKNMDFQEQGTMLTENRPVPAEVIRSTRSFREQLLADPYRPAYHFCIPEDDGRPGDPNGTFYHNGRYHLMYLYHREGSGFTWDTCPAQTLCTGDITLMPSDRVMGIMGSSVEEDLWIETGRR